MEKAVFRYRCIEGVDEKAKISCLPGRIEILHSLQVLSRRDFYLRLMLTIIRRYKMQKVIKNPPNFFGG